MNHLKKLTQSVVKMFTHYDPKTGVFKRTHALDRQGNIIERVHFPKVGDGGYLRINMFNEPRLVHRLVFLYMTGKLPHFVDHINGDRSDNRWKNLRGVDDLSSARNVGMYKNNKSGVKGVHFDKRRKRWQVNIASGNREKSLGSYVSFDDAVKARRKAERDMKFHPNHGRRPSWRE